MARLHPVIPLHVYEWLVGRGRLKVHGEAYLEVKLDGYLAIAYDGKVFMGSGRRAPSWVTSALKAVGVDIPATSSKIFFLEIYGACASPNGYHRRDKYCYRAALVDAGRPPAYASTVEDAAFTARALSVEERWDLAESIGAERVEARTIVLDRPPEPWEFMELLSYYRGYEGYVVKLYSSKGHVLPPDYGAKLRGLLEIKVKHPRHFLTYPHPA